MNVSRLLFAAIALTIGMNTMLAQQEQCDPGQLLKVLEPDEEIQLMNLPVLQPPPGYPLRDLPSMVDNSVNPCMRPVFNQAGLCCGQAAGIAYNYTYELDRERGADASLAENQYVTHFPWNFMNGGNGWYGVSYLHSFQIVKECGMPNVVDYGGSLSYGGEQRWMSGYEAYYSAMHNRLNHVYQIQGGTPEGLQVIKNWLFDHLEQSAIGGVCNFYAQYMSATNTLPAGTPEAGKYVLTTFGGSANHAMTIVGYNDSIRWDYNGDGQYTNTIDINSDGIVDMKDWEIGGFKMVQSYGGVPNWGDQGYAYMMYKTIADNIGSGGIWNHCVHVLDVKDTYEPKLTARIILKHDWRGKIGVSVGLANNPSAQAPEISFVYPIFDYQASNQYMQGGTTEEDKTIEFGLDLSKFISYIELGQDVKFFLNVVEKDPDNQGTGQVNHFSIYDHTAGGIEITSPQSNVPINENDTTTLTLIHNISFDRVHIVDENLPPAPPGQPYSFQLTATGGTEPYTWELDKTYEEYNGPAVFPNVTENQLSPTNSNNGWVTQQIEFPFPFYDSVYSDITVHVDGYLMFDEQLYPYPYFIDDKVLFQITRNISPFMNQHQNIVSGAGQGLFYEGDANSATFRWKTCLEGNTSEVLNYAVTLYPDGNIEFYYGNNTATAAYLWVSGISDGDNINFQQTVLSNKPTLPADYRTELAKYTYPPELSFSEEGTYSGAPLVPYNAENITFKVTDNNFISSWKTLQLSGNGVVVMDSISAGGNQVIEFGETVLQTVKLINIEDQPISAASMTIHISDPYVTVLDSTQELGTLPVGVVRRFIDAFSFTVSPDIPDHHLIEIQTEVNSDTNIWTSVLSHYAYAPVTAISNILVDDDNNRLDAGDTSDIIVTLVNSGGAPVTSMYAMLSSTDPDVTINTGLANIAYLPSAGTEDASFNVSVSDEVLSGHIITFVLDMTGDQGFVASDTFELAVGMFQEDFETGDFSLFKWGCQGNQDWHIDMEMAYEGSFSAKSGPITHGEESVLMLDFIAQQEGEVSFFANVSCEDDTSANNNYDYLAFFVDAVEKGRWDGQTGWQQHAYNITTGYHRLEWRYHKDNTVNRGYDAAWIDLVSFPAPVTAGPDLSCSDTALAMLLRPEELEYDTLYLTNTGPGDISFTLDIAGLEQYTSSRGSRSMAGSTLVSSGNKVHTNKAYTWDLRTYCASPDNEWTRDIYVGFPEGVEVVVGSQFDGGSGGPLNFMGPVGNGATSQWHGEDENGWGVIHGGESATGTVTFFVHSYLSGNPWLTYEVHGDVYGSLPHVVAGNIEIRNLGPEVTWLSAGIAEGTIAGGITMPLVLEINTEGLVDGTYQAWIILTDNHFHEQIIPVTLTLDTYLATEGSPISRKSINIYPNPFNSRVNLNIPMEEYGRVEFSIFDLNGLEIKSYQADMSAGQHQISWDGKDASGNPVAAGLYVGRISVGGESYYVKMMKGTRK